MKSFLFIFVAFIYFILYKKNKNSVYNINSTKKQRFDGNLEDHEAGLITSLMAKVAKADGRVSELEAELLSNTFTQLSSVFENQDEVRERLKAIYKKELEVFKNTLEVADKYYKLTKRDYRRRYATLEYLINLAFIDNEFTKEEQMICEDISNALEINRSDFENLIAKFRDFYASKYNQQVSSLKNAYEVIGADENDDMNTIKSKYKKLVRKNHPDLLMGSGADKSIIEEATQRLQKINEAYEIIKKAKA